MHRNDTKSKMVQGHNGAKAKAKAKAKERTAGWETGTLNPFVAIGARGMAIAAMRQRATSRTMARKEERREKEKKGQHRYRPMP